MHFDIDKFIRMSEFEDSAGGRKKSAILGDVMEAVLGALYIDGGLDAARIAYDVFWKPRLEELSKYHRDSKTALQEWSQRKKRGTPSYKVIDAEGPAHAPAFTVEVEVAGFNPVKGVGKSKRSAQMQAARAFLIREGVWRDDE